jgi:peptide/nickel transport system permease protein
MGLSYRYILRRDLLPNLMPYIAMNFMTAGRNVIFAAVGLYFLGVLPFSTSNWGVMLNVAVQRNAHTDPDLLFWIFVPILALAFLSVGVIFFSQGLDRLFNPRVRARYAQEDAEASVEVEEESTDTVMGGGQM